MTASQGAGAAAGKAGGGALLAFATEAAGRLQAWRSARQLRAHASIGGTMWGRKGHPDLLADVWIDVEPQQQRVTYSPFGAGDRYAVYEPDRTAVVRADGELLAERLSPRAAFASHTPETLWDELDVVYFSGYAIWNYLNTPFLLTLPGVVTRELDPWEENEESWRRLEVTFPDSIATHNSQQTFYFDSRDGLLRRHDYNADVFGGVATANYAFAPARFDGLVLPTQRRVVMRNSDNTTNQSPVLVSIDIAEIRVSR